MVSLSALGFGLSVLSLVSCHFTLDYPTSRGFSDDDEPVAPCGGFTTGNSTVVTPFSVSGGQYQVDIHHAMSVVSVVLSKDGKTFGNTAIQQYSVTGLGTVCAKLGPLDGFSSGDHVTMQIVFKSSTESKNLYQCADLRLVNVTSTPASCTNSSGIVVSGLKSGSIALSGTSSATSETATSKSNATISDAQSTNSATSTGLISNAVNISFFILALLGCLVV